MWLLLISLCANSFAASCTYVSTEQTFSSFSECLNIGSAALHSRESVSRITDYRCVKVR